MIRDSVVNPPCQDFFRLWFLDRTRPPVSEQLADNAFQCSVIIAIAKRDTMVVAKIILCQVAVQMLFAAVLVDAFHAALEDRVVALDRVRVDVAANIFLFFVMHPAIAGLATQRWRERSRCHSLATAQAATPASTSEMSTL